jgi:eukaryotic-like serine/threonine-protein kinase
VRGTWRAIDGIGIAMIAPMRSAWIAILIAGCKLAGTSGAAIGPGPSSPTSTSGEPASSGSGRLTMPDLRGMTQDQAKAALERAGSTGTFLTDVGLCEDTQIPHMHVCDQSPDPGADSATESPVHVVLQQESPESDTPGVAGAHYKMPDAIGLSPAQAKAKLAAAGFSHADNIQVHIDGDCDKPGIICRSDPAPGVITTTSATKQLFIGQTQQFYSDFFLFE